MRLSLPRLLAFRIPLESSFALPGRRLWAPIFLVCLAFQPLGSLPGLAMYCMAVLYLTIAHPTNSKILETWSAFVLYLVVAMAALSVFGQVNLRIFAFYICYWTLGVLAFSFLSQRIGTLQPKNLYVLINGILFMDLALNLPAIVIEALRFGFGDYMTGFSGILMSESLSQNRTHSVRSVMLLILALANYQRQRNGLSLFSAAFNLATVFLATSMTTLFSGFAAAGILLAIRKRSLATPIMFSALILLVIGANALNQMIFRTDSAFDYITEINTKWLPKLDIYRQYLFELVPERPWMAFIGTGFGNGANRFVILANYHNYSSFPGKEVLSDLFSSPFTKYYLVDYYSLEEGVVGKSIIGTPWSSSISVLLEIGLLGIGLTFLLAWRFFRDLWKSDVGSFLGSGKYLLLFFIFNLFFDCYLDYPEVVVPFFAVACLLRAMMRPEAVLNRVPGEASGAIPPPLFK